MKVNEIEDGKVLMIDDLVIGCIETDIVGEATYKILCKVTDINHYGDVSCKAIEPFPDELDWQDGDDFSWIEPIPLTPEILEKNGFKEYNGYGYASNKGYCFEGFYINYDFTTRIANIDCKFNYVHKLQNALKLCGIEKQIKL